MHRRHRSQLPSSWSSAGALAYVEDGDIWVAPPDGDPEPFVSAPGPDSYPEFSPDGDWLVFQDSEGALYARPYPAGDPAILIAEEGAEPAWTADGERIVYTQANSYYEVPVQLDGSTLRPGVPRLLLRGALPSRPVRGHDIAADGSILTVSGIFDWFFQTPNAEDLVWVLNWVEEVEERLGGG